MNERKKLRLPPIVPVVAKIKPKQRHDPDAHAQRLDRKLADAWIAEIDHVLATQDGKGIHRWTWTIMAADVCRRASGENLQNDPRVYDYYLWSAGAIQHICKRYSRAGKTHAYCISLFDYNRVYIELVSLDKLAKWSAAQQQHS